MKPIYLLFPLCLIAAFTQVCFAVPSAQLKYVTDSRDKFIIDKIAQNKEISYCMYIDEEDAQIIQYEDLDTWIHQSLGALTQGVSAQIKEAARADEFKDIIEILDKPVQLKRINCNLSRIIIASNLLKNNYFKNQQLTIAKTPDLTFLTHSALCNDAFGTSFFAHKPIPFVCFDISNPERYLKEETRKSAPIFLSASQTAEYTDQERKLFLTLMHEIGHAMTLGDQYEKGLKNNDIMFSSVEPGEGLMASTGTITCDDIDGIINALDRSTGTKRTFKSLCQDGNIFENGMPVLTGEVTKTIKSSTMPGHSRESIYTLDQNTRKTLTYKEESEDTYSVDTVTIKILKKELGKYFKQADTKDLDEFYIETNRTLVNNIPVGKAIKVIKVGEMTFIKHLNYINGKEKVESIEVSSPAQNKENLLKSLTAVPQHDKR